MLLSDRDIRAHIDAARVVLAADVPDARLTPGGEDELATVLVPDGLVPWDSVVSIHVDGPDAAARVTAAAAGDAEALDALGEEDLLWFDVTERDAVVAQLG